MTRFQLTLAGLPDARLEDLRAQAGRRAPAPAPDAPDTRAASLSLRPRSSLHQPVSFEEEWGAKDNQGRPLSWASPTAPPPPAPPTPAPPARTTAPPPPVCE